MSEDKFASRIEKSCKSRVGGIVVRTDQETLVEKRILTIAYDLTINDEPLYSSLFVWKATTGRVGRSPAEFLKIQYWFNRTGMRGRGNGAQPMAASARGVTGPKIFSILTLAEGIPC